MSLGRLCPYENNMYIDLTTMTLSRCLTVHLNDSSFIALHLKSCSLPKSKFPKILVENITIIAHKINKPQLQILEALHVKIKLKIATIFLNAFGLV